MKREMHALLVGIEHWQAPVLADYPLEGCLNDVSLLAEVLRERFGLRPENTCILRNEEATRAAILDAFRRCLVEPARQWREAGRPVPAPALVFHFSGHGSQAVDATGTQPHGRDQTIVPYDSRTPGIFDIKDWELGQLLDEVSVGTDNVTVFLDCCHSGSGTRSAGGPTVRRGRSCPLDERPQPPRILDGKASIAKRANSGTRSAPEEPASGHVLIAACSADQAAFPHDDDSTGTRRVYGRLSFALGSLLRHPDAWSLTYRELHGQIVDLVRSWGGSQTPQCEGDRERLLFGEERPSRDLWLRVIESGGRRCKIDGGAALGLAVGDLLDAYPPQARTLATAGPPRWKLRLARVGATTSDAEVSEIPLPHGSSTSDSSMNSHADMGADSGADSVGRLDGDRSFQGGPIPLGARAPLTASRSRNPPLRVRFAPGDEEGARQLARALVREDLAERVVVVGPDSQSTEGVPTSPRFDAFPPLRLSRWEQGWKLVDGDGRFLARCPEDSVALGDLLARFAHWQSTLRVGPRVRTTLAGQVSLRMQRVLGRAEASSPGRPGALITEAMEAPDGGDLRVPHGTPVCFEMANRSPRPVYLQALFFGYDGSISRIYPRHAGEQVAVAPGRNVQSPRFGVQFGAEDVEVDEVREFVKVIATVEPFDSEGLCRMGSHRALVLEQEDDWTVADVSFLLVR